VTGKIYQRRSGVRLGVRLVGCLGGCLVVQPCRLTRFGGLWSNNRMKADFDAASIVLRSRLVGIVRSATPIDLAEACHALYAGGLQCVEVTLNSPGALHAIERVRADLPAGCVIGAGTVLDTDSATQALEAGAQFLVTPVVDIPTIQLARSRTTPIIPGAYTPTEIYTAWKAGATLVKLFPATNLGAGFVREVLAPLPELKLCPTGGVTLQNVGDWFSVGAAAVGVGSALMPKAAMENGQWDDITALARRWMEAVTPSASPG
jgi:2-dehydro-3-deoxyphosphogluconate aldolase / (4S)-4-hydroxy-2-oxoglutarate aldolase